MFLFLLIAIRVCTISISSEGVYEYYFFPGETEKIQSDVSDEYDSFINSLPDEIKEQFPEDLFSEGEDIVSRSQEIIDFKFIWDKIISGIVDTLFPSLRSLFVIIGILIVSVLIKQFKKNVSDKETDKLTDTVINTGIILSIISTDIISLDSVEKFKDLICNIMNGMIPVFGIVYTASGNGSTAAIHSGGVMLLVTLCQNLFAVVLMPSVRICLIMSIANAIFPESGIRPVATVFKNISIGIMTVCVTLFSFVLGLQNTIAQAADSFGIRSIKFAVGNLVPIIGGAVSDSLGTIGGSLSILKSAGGTITIVIIIFLLLPTISQLLMRRFSLFLGKCIAGILDCSNEEKLIEDIGSTVSIMLAFSVAMSIAFIYVLTLFTGSTLAIMN